MKNLFLFALLNFLVASIIGVTMRFAFWGDLGSFNYTNLMHAHSHLAMMGWVFVVLIIMIAQAFVPTLSNDYRSIRYWLWTNQWIVSLMTLSFIASGYSIYSILFSSLHLLVSYILVKKIWRHIDINSISGLMMRTSIVFMLISSLAVWFLPVVINNLGRNSEYYYMSIQFFLHFQFNGWFIFAILGLKFKFWKELSVSVNMLDFKKFYIPLVLSCLLTYTQSVTWSSPSDFLFKTNSLGVALQLVAIIYLLKILWLNRALFNKLNNNVIKISLLVGIVSFILKSVIQTAVAIPSVAIISYTIRQFVIGFIHLTLLGAVTGTLIGLAIKEGLLMASSTAARSGLLLLLIGTTGSEVFLFVQGILLWAQKGFLPFYYQGLFWISLLMPLGILTLLLHNFHYTRIKLST